MVALTIAPAAEPSRVPAKAPSGPQLPIQPRRPGGAPSTRKTDEAMYSPPTAIPWSRRNTSSRTGAASPIVTALGSTPMQKEGTAIAGREEVRPDLLREESKEGEVVPLEYVAHEAGDHAPAHGGRGAELLGDHAGRRDGGRDGGHGGSSWRNESHDTASDSGTPGRADPTVGLA